VGLEAQENNMIQDKIKEVIQKALKALGVPADMVTINLEHPGDAKHGDYSTNVAMALFKQLGATHKTPFELAQKIVTGIQEQIKYSYSAPIHHVEAIQPGFINFYLTKDFFKGTIAEAINMTAWYGKNTRLWNKKVIIEHTNMNPFKPFHIGHLVNNAVGESLSRILEFQDAKLTRASYGGDIGLHVAKTLWGVLKMKDELPEKADARTYVDFLGKAYAAGNTAYEEGEAPAASAEALAAKQEIKDINKKVFDKSDAHINELYEWGKKQSLEYFAELYQKLGTNVDLHYLESQVADEGLRIVKEYLARGIFKESEGAIIYPGEEKGLHNRVFITSQGLPTYEAKEVGLTRKKFEYSNFDESIIVTANEQDDYFKVVLRAIGDVYPEIAKRTKHLSHGMLRLTTGKMSSRKGNVITGESFLQDIETLALERIKDKEYPEEEKREIASRVALAAIKYTILKQSVGRDIIFDPDKSLSLEGDSGPYLQYTYVRTRSVLEKAQAEGIAVDATALSSDKELPLERMVYKFPEIVARAAQEYAPQYIATYLIELASEFNRYYAETKIIEKGDPESPYRVAITDAIRWTLKNGLYLLGIQAPTRM
jgi:arginyl-tRNA synthetase